MEENSFDLGLVVGRFEPIHLGHEKLIDISLKSCDKTALLVTYNNLDKNNPFSFEYVIHLINKIYSNEIESGRLKVIPFKNDTEFNESYGDKIISVVNENFSKKPDFIVYGSDKNISKCFSNVARKNIFEVKVNREELNISATDIRKALNENNIEFIKKYINPKIYDEISSMKDLNNRL